MTLFQNSKASFSFLFHFWAHAHMPDSDRVNDFVGLNDLLHLISLQIRLKEGLNFWTGQRDASEAVSEELS